MDSGKLRASQPVTCPVHPSKMSSFSLPLHSAHIFFHEVGNAGACLRGRCDFSNILFLRVSSLSHVEDLRSNYEFMMEAVGSSL